MTDCGLRSKRPRFCRQTSLPRFCNYLPSSHLPHSHRTTLTQVHMFGYLLASSFAASPPQLVALRMWQLSSEVTQCLFTRCCIHMIFTSFSRYLSHIGERNRLRITASHISSSKKFPHVRRLFCYSSRPSLWPHRHHRQARQPAYPSPTFAFTRFSFNSSTAWSLTLATTASK
jgi:hypothetical protein